MTYDAEEAVEIFDNIIFYYVDNDNDDGIDQYLWKKTLRSLDNKYYVNKSIFVTTYDILAALNTPSHLCAGISLLPISYLEACCLLQHIVDKLVDWHQISVHMGLWTDIDKYEFLDALFNQKLPMPEMKS